MPAPEYIDPDHLPPTRIDDHIKFFKPEFWVLVALAGLGGAVAVACLLWTLAHWRTNLVKLAQRQLMVAVALAAAALSASLGAFAGAPSDARCAVRLWGVSLSIAGLEAALYLKMLRVNLLLKHATALRRKAFGGRWLASRAAVLVGIDAAILLAWRLTAGAFAARDVVDGRWLGARAVFRACRSADPAAGQGFAVALVLYKAGLLAVTGRLAYRARDLHAKCAERRARRSRRLSGMKLRSPLVFAPSRLSRKGSPRAARCSSSRGRGRSAASSSARRSRSRTAALGAAAASPRRTRCCCARASRRSCRSRRSSRRVRRARALLRLSLSLGGGGAEAQSLSASLPSRCSRSA